ncbi:unnamed protein product (macronuclear) [Paramecium tetraurelia]|uniref:Uncharacterized protein n=1 Tax=Paramecium tetraurelia TaxID=5888 RepID=A0BPG7_PARTE|nr:uncharacterized protein GSPATT00005183001 [Paramecium tetraurelia]CAK60434.1 unnamed protein product [Paramecium tetraurelia]|eukprot:XP_001427832.1 hypothetical protein (macronuclear) [Paramecium tetraurelia strain d4-2]
MANFQEFLSSLGQIKQMEIPFYYRNQFKIKENFINPNSKHFDQIAQKLLSEDNKGLKRKWDKQCKMLFIWVIVKYFQVRNKKNINPNSDEWLELSGIFNFDEVTLKQRWITLINPMAKSLNWESEEDDIIRSLMIQQEEKHIWTQIALELYNHNNGLYVRTPKQVRERWMNYLNPKLNKSSWTDQEDHQLLQLVVNNGKRWSLISSLLQGRTENQVKNRYKSLIHKIFKEEDDDEIEEIQAIRQYLAKQTSTAINQENNPSDSVKNETKIKCEESQSKSINIQKPKKKQQLKNQDEQELQIQIKKKKVKVIENLYVKQEIDKKISPKLLNQQFCLSTNGNCDTQSQENRKGISSSHSQGSIQNQEFECQSQQFIQSQSKCQLQSPSYIGQTQTKDTIPQYTGFRPYMNDACNDLFQQTPCQINRLGFGLKQHTYPFQQLSPFQQQIQQTPIVYTPLYLYNSQFIAQSPYKSPILSPHIWILRFRMNSQSRNNLQIFMCLSIQNNKLEFLQGQDLVSKWKNKRVQEKQNQSELNKIIDQ